MAGSDTFLLELLSCRNSRFICELSYISKDPRVLIRPLLSNASLSPNRDTLWTKVLIRAGSCGMLKS